MTSSFPLHAVRDLVEPGILWSPAKDSGEVIRYIDVSAVNRDELQITGTTEHTPDTAPSRARKLVNANDTLFATIRPGLRRIAQVPYELDGAVASTAFCVLRPKPTRVDPDFLFFATSSERFVAAVADRQTGASYPAVRDADVLNGEIPLPPLDEQRQIAVVLRTIRKALSCEANLIDQASMLKRAAMRELFTRGLRGEAQKESDIGPIPESWECVPFGTVREWLQYGTSIRCTTTGGKHPVLRIPNLAGGEISTDDLKYCDLSDDQADVYSLKEGDLLFVRTNGVIERLGSCAVYEGRPNGALFASYLIRARLKANLLPKFAAFFFGSERGTALVAGSATPAADGKYNLNTGIIDSLPIPLPPTLDEQHGIIVMLEAIDRKIQLQKKKRAALDILFKSLLRKLMTSEIRVSDLDLSALRQTSAAQVSA